MRASARRRGSSMWFDRVRACRQQGRSSSSSAAAAAARPRSLDGNAPNHSATPSRLPCGHGLALVSMPHPCIGRFFSLYAPPPTTTTTTTTTTSTAWEPGRRASSSAAAAREWRGGGERCGRGRSAGWSTGQEVGRHQTIPGLGPNFKA